MKKIYICLPLVLWLLLSITDIWSLFFQFPKPMYFRAWEYVLNENAPYTPFKPRALYDGMYYGDLINGSNFVPGKSEISRQIFQADEYGFRNPVGFLHKPIDAVIFGSSFVGGAAITQDDLVNSLLTKKYGIRTYNYATRPIQYFWSDTRFFHNTPKYAVIIGNESEIVAGNGIEILQDTPIKITIPQWKSYVQWAQSQDTVPLTYTDIRNYSQRFSLVKYVAFQIYRSGLNKMFPRKIIASELVARGTYDPGQDRIFFNVDYNPTLTKTSRTMMTKTIAVLKNTQEVLKKRNITLLIAAMPSKEALYAPQYRTVPLAEKNSSYFEDAMEKNHIGYIKLSSPAYSIVHQNKAVLYSNGDTHWNGKANELIAQLLAEKITEIESLPR